MQQQQQQQSFQIKPAGSPFTPHERARLAIYKMAVEARFYTDWCPQPASARCQNLVRIDQICCVDESGMYEFSVAEVARLQAYKAFVSAGVFSDSFEAA
jgi:hypothetical protein